MAKHLRKKKSKLRLKGKIRPGDKVYFSPGMKFDPLGDGKFVGKFVTVAYRASKDYLRTKELRGTWILRYFKRAKNMSHLTREDFKSSRLEHSGRTA